MAYVFPILIVLCALVAEVLLFAPRSFQTTLFIGIAIASGVLIHAVMTFHMNNYRRTVCNVRISVNQEVTLVYRSWWPHSLSVDTVQASAVSAAIEAADTWYQAHRETPLKLVISHDEAFHLTLQYLGKWHDNNEGGSSSSCPICLDPMKGTSTELVKCHHRFHEDCIVEWFARGKLACPSCRTDHVSCLPAKIQERYMGHSPPVISVVSSEVLRHRETS